MDAKFKYSGLFIVFALAWNGSIAQELNSDS